MKQHQLVKEIYLACINHDNEKLEELRRIEFEKVAKRKKQGKSFGPKWTVVR